MFDMTGSLRFVFSVFYITLTFLRHRVLWFSIACIVLALLNFRLTMDYEKTETLQHKPEQVFESFFFVR